MNRRPFSALCLGGIMMGVVFEALGFPNLSLPMRLLLLLYMALEWRRLHISAKALVSVTGVLGLCATVEAGNTAALAQALDRATLFAAFFANQFLMREAARHSPLVRRCALYLSGQSAGRTYGFLTLGGYLFGAIINLGVLSLLGMVIRRELPPGGLAAAGHDQVVRSRRMVLALLRGFSATPIASPMSLALAVMLTAFTGLRWWDVLPLGMATGALLLAVGWMLDRREPVAPSLPAHAGAASREGIAAVAGIGGIVLLTFALAVGIESACDIPLVRAILVATPLAGAGWLVIQGRRLGPWRAAALAMRRAGRHAGSALPSYRSEIGILASAGAIGALVPELWPIPTMALLFADITFPSWVMVPLLMLAILLPSMVGINPIVTGSVIAATLAALPSPLLPAPVAAVALMAGWAMTANASPLTASALLLADVVGTRAERITHDWNRLFVVTAFPVMAAFLTIMASA